MSPPAAAPRKRPQVALWVFVGLVALALVGSLVTISVASGRRPKPADVARGYLEALAAGDAAKALSYGWSAPADQTLLTDAVLADSQRRAPISDIVVRADSSTDETVDVSYRLGDQPVTDQYGLSRVSGEWKMDRTSVPVDYIPAFSVRLPVVVNGVTVDFQQVESFPVSYAVTTGLKTVDWGEGSTTTIDLGQGVNRLDLEPRLTTEGKKEFVAGARETIGACLKQHKLAPVNCPFGFQQPTHGPRIPDSTVRWSLQNDPWGSFPTPEIDAAVDSGTARAKASMTFRNTCRYSTGQACTPADQKRTVIFDGDLATEPIDVRISPY